MVRNILLIVGTLIVFAGLSFFTSHKDSFIQDNAQKINAKSVFDAAATTGETNVSVTILPNPPEITLALPLNVTYRYNNSIPLQVNFVNITSAISTAFYNIDNGANISLTLVNNANSTALALSEGSHTIRVFANETNAGVMNSTARTFSVNNSVQYTLNYTKFNGASTNLSILNSTQLQSISNFILELASFGRIAFNEVINLTADNITYGSTNLDAFVNISSSIFINDTIFPNLNNKQATLAFYNATTSFTNPRVLRNSDICPATICIATWAQGQTFFVNVTNFSMYGLEETPGSEAARAVEGGGGIFKRKQSAAGEGAPAPSKSSEAATSGPQQELPQQQKALFDVKIELLRSQIEQGDNVFFKVDLLNFGEQSKIEVDLKYILLDSEGNILFTVGETKTIETQTQFIKKIPLPATLNIGKYTLIVTLDYGNQHASSQETLEIIPKTASKVLYYSPLIVLIITMVLYFWRKKKYV